MKVNPSELGAVLPKLYDHLSPWWPLLSRPADYAEEAAFYAKNLLAVGGPPARTLLELGSGGGNNASHLKAQFRMTLVDLSPGMLAVSRELNPECEHIRGDMRTIRLGREFDRVFIHDAIEHDRHIEGLFARAEWLQILADAGFQPHVVPFEHSELEPGSSEVFLGVKPSM